MLHQRENHLYYVYIMVSISRVLYVGVTINIYERVRQHKQTNNKSSFTARYRITRLVYYEEFEYVLNALDREKQLKKWHRSKKLQLISMLNPEWIDLSLQWYKWK